MSEEEDDKEFANVVLEQFNICLPRCIRPNHGGNAGKMFVNVKCKAFVKVKIKPKL